MYTGILHSHTLVVTLYLILFLIKAVLLFIGKKESLQKFRAKTRIAEMILGVVFIVSGVYLWTESAAANNLWLYVKLLAIAALIPLGIVGFKKQSKPLVALSLVLFLYAYGISETKSWNFQKDMAELYGQEVDESKVYNSDSKDYDQLAHGKYLYEAQCIACHRENGQGGYSGAKNLQKSELGDKEIRNIILNGKLSMPAYEGMYSDEEIEALTAYVKSFRE